MHSKGYLAQDSILIYIAEGRMEDAERALRRLRPVGWSVADELDEMKTTLAAEARIQSSVGYRTLFQNPIDRRRTILSVLGLTTQAASGAMFVICKLLLAPHSVPSLA